MMSVNSDYMINLVTFILLIKFFILKNCMTKALYWVIASQNFFEKISRTQNECLAYTRKMLSLI